MVAEPFASVTTQYINPTTKIRNGKKNIPVNAVKGSSATHKTEIKIISMIHANNLFVGVSA